MKRISLFALFIFLGLFLACSRDEPIVAPPPPPTVVTPTINEIYSQGDSLNPDWVEIYNPSTSQIDLSGYKIYDSGGQSGSKPKKVFNVGTILPANGFVVIVVDDTTESGFGLSSSGEGIWFEDATGIVIDNLTFPALGKDTSYARNPNGSTTWVLLSPPTKGSSNGLSPVVMNEIYSRGIPGTDPDWIEIYNPNSDPIDLSGFKIYDSGGAAGSKPKKEFPAGTIIPANGFYVIVTDDAAADGSGFGLSSAGEEVWLENSSGTVIDNYTFLTMDVTQSFSRIPDGTANWQLSNTITRGAPNQP